MAYYGIDVSEFQGDIDWVKVKVSGVQFAIIRAGFGSFPQGRKDYKFDQNVKQAKAAGVPFGAYWYSYASNTQYAALEADNFLSTIKGIQFAYPVYFDFEDPSQNWLTNQQRTDIVNTFCSKVEQAGYYVGIYANLYTFQSKLNLNGLVHYDKWLAQWAAQPTYGDDFGGLWQNSNNGSIPGIVGRVDTDVSYRDYPSIIMSAGLNGFGTVTPTPPPTTAHKLGEYVSINGIYTTSDSTQKLNPAIPGGTITEILVGHRNPYLLNNGSGWVNDRVITSGSKPAVIKVGSIVRIKNGAPDYYGTPLASFVYKNTYRVIELNGKRAVLGGIMTAVNTDNLILIS